MLAELLKTRQKPGYIIPIYEGQALKDGQKDSLHRRRDVFHPSEISGDFCPRSWLLHYRDVGLYAKRKITPQNQAWFDVGTALHSMVQERLGNAGVLWGNWICNRWCLDERCTHVGFKPDDRVCPKIDTRKPQWEYCELPVVDEELNIGGSTDGVCVLPIGKYVFEFKTANTNTYDTLVEPLEIHKEQSMWYLDILSRKDRELEKMFMLLQADGIDTAENLSVVRMPFRGVIILYMNKNDQSLREFIVDYHTKVHLPAKVRIEDEEDLTVKEVIEEKKILLKETLVHMEKGTLPPKLDVCISKSCARARRCNASNVCFEQD